VALSMEEQRMLDEMERALAAADPRLASRLNAFGEQRMPGVFSSPGPKPSAACSRSRSSQRSPS